MPLLQLFQFAFAATLGILSMQGDCFKLIFQVEVENVYMGLAFRQYQNRFETPGMLFDVLNNQCVSLRIVNQNS